MLRRKTPLLLLCCALAACAAQATPEDALMANNLCAQGKTLLATGKTGDARDIYASAAHRDADNPRAWNGLGVADDLLGKRSEAENAYKRAIDLAPRDPTATNNLAHLYIANGDPDAAVQLLEPFAGDPKAPVALRQNLDAARKAVQTEQALGGGVYADLGSYPTEGMAQGHAAAAKKLLGSDAGDMTFSIVPEVKVAGGTPMFTVKVTGKSPQDICDELNPQAFPCVVQK